MDQLLKKVISLREEVDQIIELIETERNKEEGEIKDSAGKKRQREEERIFFKKRKDRIMNITEEEMRCLFKDHKIEYTDVTVYKGVYGIASLKNGHDINYCIENKDHFSKDYGIIFEEYVRGGGRDKKKTNI